jgi:surfeit locus 1 family protein
VLKTPRPIIAVLTLLGIGFFLRLGFWQLDRAAFKDQLFQNFQQGSGAAPMNLREAIAKAQLQSSPAGAGANVYLPVRVPGQFLPNKTILLDNQSVDGQYGVQVYQLLDTTEGQALIVALGFLPAARDRSQFPTPQIAEGPQQLSGLLAYPSAGGLALAEDPPQQGAIDLVTRLSLPRARQFFARPKLLPLILLLDPKQSGLVSSDSYVRKWLPNTFPAERHRGYAVTWFGLAATVLIVFIILHRKT